MPKNKPTPRKRKSKEERRRAPRARVNLPARWEGASTQQTASITDLSKTGCFVLSGGDVTPLELVRLEITFPDETQVYPWGEVVEEAAEIGFAVRFTWMDPNELERLEAFVTQTLASSQ